MTELQLTEIRNYLLSKKLPIDILIEVNDHFISQISDLQREENLSFEEAKNRLIKAFRESFNVEFIEDDLSNKEKDILEKLNNEN